MATGGRGRRGTGPRIDADFAAGELFRLTTAVADQLSNNTLLAAYDVVWITNSSRGTVIKLDPETARAIALADQAPGAQVASVHPVVSDPPSEYRGLPLPAWRVVMDDREGTSVYVDRAAGRVRARRNHAWRRHDFFWMLHTMDYRGRDDFNHPLLVVAAALGMLSSLSGLLLWSLRIRRRMRRRKESA